MVMKLRSRILQWLLAAAAVVLAKLVFRSLRIRYVCASEAANPFSPRCREAFIYAVWHDHLLVALFAGRHRRTVALVSKHQDGSYLASALRILGIGAVRGSSSRHGAIAMRELLRLEPDQKVVITPDGPRGPRRKVKPGLVYLGSRTGRPIVPTAFSCTNYWAVRAGWSTLMIPKPFSTLYAVAGEPIIVPQSDDVADRSAADRTLQEEMDRLNQWADSLVLGSFSSQPHSLRHAPSRPMSSSRSEASRNS
jgi:lysophospholipid acyltransferase (LPLAT)-like uncharacterized protein